MSDLRRGLRQQQTRDREHADLDERSRALGLVPVDWTAPPEEQIAQLRLQAAELDRREAAEDQEVSALLARLGLRRDPWSSYDLERLRAMVADLDGPS